MKAAIFLVIIFAVLGAKAGIPACIAIESKDVSCKITYNTSYGEGDRDFEVADIKFAQNPGGPPCSLVDRGIFEATLEGDAQEESPLTANGFNGEISEDLAAGTFTIPKMYYDPKLPAQFQFVEGFPALTLSFRSDSEQTISFVTRHQKVEANMKCHGSELIPSK